MRVIEKNILIEKKNLEETKEIWTPKNEETSKIRTGEIIQMGPELSNMKNPPVAIGDRVRFKQYHDGEEFKIDDKEFAVMSYKSILIIY